MPRWGPLKSLHRESLHQSVDNPLQPDRLPDTSGVEFDYPAHPNTTGQNRRHTLWILAAGAAVCLVLFVNEYIHGFWLLAAYVHAIVAAVAFTVFLITLLGRTAPGHKRPTWRWLAYAFAIPLAAALLWGFGTAYFIFGLAMAAAVPASDLFATHYFHLKTAMPMPRTRSKQLRELWQRRFHSLFSTANGLELYLLSLLAAPAVFLLLAYLHQRWPKPAFYSELPLLGMGLIFLLLLPVVSEWLAAFLFRRKATPLRVMFRAFYDATVQWFTYNRDNTHAPGTHQSAAATYRQRRRLSLALIVLFGCSIAQLISPHGDALNSIGPGQERRLFRTKSPASISAPATDSTRARQSMGALADRSTPYFVSYQPDAANTQTNLDKQHDAEVQLQPWEERLLSTMDEDERRAFLEKRRKQQAPPQPEANTEPEQNSASDDFFKVLLGFVTAALFAVYPVLTALLPPLFFLACCFSTAGRVVGVWRQQLGADGQDRLFRTETWDELVQRIRTSDDKDEKFSLLLGVNAFDDTPVIVPRAVFQEHAHILGDSGSGKTSLGISSLLTQFIRFRDCSLVILDLKGDDMALFECAREEAKEVDDALKQQTESTNGQTEYPFRWFTNELGRSTYIFNPLKQRHFSQLSLYQRTDILTSAMGLQYGTDYGRGYFADANADLLFHAIKAEPNLRSFAELGEVLRDREAFRTMNPQLRTAAAHLLAIVNRLAACRALNSTPGDRFSFAQATYENAIDLAEVFEKPQVVYFHLPSAIGTASSAEIARLALYSLLFAAKSQGPRRTQVYVFVDEFQRIVANNLDLFLQTARSMNIGVILANQTIMDLKTADVDLVSTVRANTRFRQIFAASDLEEQREATQSSGETVTYNRAWTQYLALAGVAGAVASTNTTEMITPRLRPNDILLATDHPQQSIVYIRRGQGYAQFGGLPFIMTSAHHISKKVYEERKVANWPEQTEETIVSTLEMELADLTPGPARDPFVEPSKQDSPVAPEQTPASTEQTPEAKPSDAAPAVFEQLDQHWHEQRKRRKGADDATDKSH